MNWYRIISASFIAALIVSPFLIATLVAVSLYGWVAVVVGGSAVGLIGGVASLKILRLLER